MGNISNRPPSEPVSPKPVSPQPVPSASPAPNPTISNPPTSTPSAATPSASTSTPGTPTPDRVNLTPKAPSTPKPVSLASPKPGDVELKEALEILDKNEFETYAINTLVSKLGLAHTHAGRAAGDLWLMKNADTDRERLRHLARFAVHVYDAPEAKSFLDRELGPIIDRLPENVQIMGKRLLGEGNASEARLFHLSTMLDDDFNMQDLFAFQSLLQDMGTDVIDLLPQSFQDKWGNATRSLQPADQQKALFLVNDLIKNMGTLKDGTWNLRDLIAIGDLLNSAGRSLIPPLPDRAQNLLDKLGEKKLIELTGRASSVLVNMDKLTDDKWEPADILALYELLYKAGDNYRFIRDMLPPGAQKLVGKIEKLTGANFLEHMDKLLHALPETQNAAVKALFSTLTAPNAYLRLNAALDFSRHLSVQILGEGNRVDALLEVLNIDFVVAQSFEKVLSLDTPARVRTEHLHRIANHYKVRSETLAKKLTPQVAQAQAEVSTEVARRTLQRMTPAEHLKKLLAESQVPPEQHKLFETLLSKENSKNALDKVFQNLEEMSAWDQKYFLEHLSDLEPEEALEAIQRPAFRNKLFSDIRTRQLDLEPLLQKFPRETRDTLEKALAFRSPASEKTWQETLERVARLEPDALARSSRALGDDPDLWRQLFQKTEGWSLIQHAADRAEILNELSGMLNLGDEAQQSLQQLLLKNPNVSDEAFEKAVIHLKKLTAEESDNVLKIIQKMNPEAAARVLGSDTLGAPFLKSVSRLSPWFKKIGMSSADIAPKLAAGLSKAVPAIGAVASAVDTQKMLEIAYSGQRDGKTYDPELRVLAMLGAAVNGADTLIGVAEAFGVGNVAFPIQLGLAGTSVSIDIMIEYFAEHPDKMPAEMRLALKALALGTAISAPLAMPGSGLGWTATVMQIYGASGTVDLASELTEVMGNKALQGIENLSDLHAESMDKALADTAENIHTLADMIRYPEKYVAIFGEKAWDAITHIDDQLLALVEQGKLAFEQALDMLCKAGNRAEEAITGLIQKGIEKGLASVQSVENAVRYALENPGEVATNILSGISNALQGAAHRGLEITQNMAENLVALAQRGGTLAANVLTTVVTQGVKGAEFALGAVKNAPAAIKQGVYTAADKTIQAGKASLGVLHYVATNPREALESIPEHGARLLLETRQSLVTHIKTAKHQVEESVQALETLYEKTWDKMEAEAHRTAKSLENLEETLVDLLKDGVDIGQESWNKHTAVLTERLPEIAEAWADLKQAPIDLMVRVGQNSYTTGKRLAGVLAARVEDFGNETLTHLSHLKEAGWEALEELSHNGKRSGRLALEALSRQGEATRQYLVNVATNQSNNAWYAMNLMSQKAREGVDSALEDLESVARQVPDAVNYLRSLGPKGIEPLYRVALASGKSSWVALDALQKSGKEAIHHLKQLALTDLPVASAAFQELREMGEGAILAVREIAIKKSAFVPQAVDFLGGMGSKAARALQDIGAEHTAHARKVIDHLKDMGAEAVQSINDLAEHLPHVRTYAIQALQGMPFQEAQRAVEHHLDALWQAGEVGKRQVQRLAGEVSQAQHWLRRKIGNQPVVRQAQRRVQQVERTIKRRVNQVIDQGRANAANLRRRAARQLKNIQQGIFGR